MTNDGLFDENIFREFNEQNKSLNIMLLSNLARWYLYDMEIVDPNEIAQQLGLQPISTEVEEKEIEESDIRMAEAIEFLPFIDAITEINARVLTTLQRDNSKKVVEKSKDTPYPLTLETLEENLGNSFRQIGFSALVAALSSGIALGIIKPGDKAFDIADAEEDYE